MNDFFEATGKFGNESVVVVLIVLVARQPKSNCFGYRPWDPIKKEFAPYKWITYEEVAKRRANLGAGIREIGKRAGVTDHQYGVGLWSQNRPEWQITGMQSDSSA